MKKAIDVPLKTKRVDPEIIVKLMVIGALQVGDNDLCVNEPGIYPKRNPHTDRKSKRG